MTIRTHIRTLTAAALLALTVVSVSAGHADAKPKHPADNGVRCAIHGNGTVVGSLGEDITFFVPGDAIIVTDSNGQRRLLKCGADGNWIDLGRTSPPADVRPVGPPPTVLAP